MEWAHATRVGILCAVLLVCIYTDVTRGKIYNKVVLPIIPAGLALWGVQDSWPGLGYSLEGLAVGCIGLLLAAIRWIAPGDGKLLTAIGALMGPVFIIWTLMFGALAGGVMAASLLMRQRMLRRWASETAVAWTAHIPAASVWGERAGFMPYSLAIAAGCVAAWFLV